MKANRFPDEIKRFGPGDEEDDDAVEETGTEAPAAEEGEEGGEA